MGEPIKNKKALQFNGTTSYVEVPYTPALGITTYTVEAWIKPAKLTGWAGLLGQQYRNFNMLLIDGYIHHSYKTDSHPVLGTDTNKGLIKANQWHHVAITNDGTTAKTYIDGVAAKMAKDQVEAIRGQLVVEEKPVILGKVCLEPGDPYGFQGFQGQMCEVRIWNIARSEEAIKRDMNHCLGGNEPGLQCYLKLDGTVVDETGNTNPQLHSTSSYAAIGAAPRFANKFIGATNALKVHLPMDEPVYQGVTSPILVSDDLLGDCLHFKNDKSLRLSQQHLRVGSQITLAFWLRLGSSTDEGRSQMIFDAVDGNGHRSLAILFGPDEDESKDSRLKFLSFDAQEGYEEVLSKAGSFTGMNRWVHIVCSKNAVSGQMKIYQNGTLITPGTRSKKRPLMPCATMSVGLLADEKLSSINLESFTGRMTDFRIYNKELSADEIQAVRDIIGVSTQQTFALTYPIKFDFFDDNERNVFYVSDDNNDNQLVLNIRNGSEKEMRLKRITGSDVVTEHHFELRFRPGTFSEQLVAGKANELQYPRLKPGTKGWEASSAIKHEDKTVSLYLRKTGGITLTPAGQAGAAVLIPLEYFSAEPTLGARGTLVQLAYKNITYTQEGKLEQLEGNRIEAIDIVNQRGKKEIPLRVGIVGSNTILNDGNAGDSHALNTLTIRIFNYLKASENEQEKPTYNKVFFQDRGTSFKNIETKFTLGFDSGEAGWALCKASETNGITISKIEVNGKPLTNFTKKESTQGISKLFEITTTNDGIAAGEFIDITLSGLKSSNASGIANLFLRYQNVPGYWDGEFVVPVEKTPIMHRDVSGSKNVGIGTSPSSDANTQLKVGGKIEASKAIISSNGNSAHSLAMGHDGTNAYVQRNGNGRLDFKLGTSEKMSITSDGKVGIGTTSPSQKLQVNGNAIIGESGTILKIGNVGHSGWAGVAHTNRANGSDYALIQNSSGETILNSKSGQGLSFRQGNEDKMVIKNGKVGIGTEKPKATLTLNGGLCVGGNTDPGSGNLQVSGTANIAGGISSAGSVGIRTTNPSIDLAIGDSDTGLKQQGDGKLAIYTNGSERIRINNDGKVGIGTKKPDAELDVNGGVNAQALTLSGGLALSGGGGKGASGAPEGQHPLRLFESWGWNFTLQDHANSGFRVGPASGTNMNHFVVKRGGNVGIGTEKPGERLEVNGKIKLSGGGNSCTIWIDAEGINFDLEKSRHGARRRIKLDGDGNLDVSNY